MSGRDLPKSQHTITARSALLVSDVHLSETHPGLTTALVGWLTRYCINASNPPEQLLILGDLFDAWVGDDQQQHPQAGSSAKDIADVLVRIQEKGIAVGFIAGNRDFLIGEEFMKPFHGRIYTDPSTLEIDGGQTFAISHGDQLCTQDIDYQQFRSKVRDAAWQRNFLAQSLEKRLAIAQNIRAQSETEKIGKAMTIMDITPDAAAQLTDNLGADGLIHGHTHRPGCYQMPNHKPRWVLSDWEVNANGQPIRGGGLWVDKTGVALRPL
jgi:UDP-2,3-diacylglucosamine hydrolase